MRHFFSNRPSKIDTPYTNVTLTNLQPNKEYELVVKSGNSEGTSILSPPITFIMVDNRVEMRPSNPSESKITALAMKTFNVLASKKMFLQRLWTHLL